MLNVDTHRHGRGKSVLVAIAVFALSCVCLHWGWNTVAVDLFAQTKSEFKHAVAFQLALFSVVAIVPLVGRLLKESASPSEER